MSLTIRQRENTIREFEQNRELLGLSFEHVARDLGTTSDRIKDIAQLQGRSIEEPWILRNYLLSQAQARGVELVPFTALVGDPRDYWFLDTQTIARGVID